MSRFRCPQSSFRWILNQLLCKNRLRVTYTPKGEDEIRRNMSAIRSTGNETEERLRRILHRRGLRYRVQRRDLPGRPDFVFPSARVAVFVDGDYWHGRILIEGGATALAERIRKNHEYWLPKIHRTVERDASNTAALTKLGWKVIRFWESDIKPDLEAAADHVEAIVRQRLALRNVQHRHPTR